MPAFIPVRILRPFGPYNAGERVALLVDEYETAVKRGLVEPETKPPAPAPAEDEVTAEDEGAEADSEGGADDEVAEERDAPPKRNRQAKPKRNRQA